MIIQIENSVVRGAAASLADERAVTNGDFRAERVPWCIAILCKQLNFHSSDLISPRAIAISFPPFHASYLRSYSGYTVHSGPMPCRYGTSLVVPEYVLTAYSDC